MVYMVRAARGFLFRLVGSTTLGGKNNLERKVPSPEFSSENFLPVEFPQCLSAGLAVLSKRKLRQASDVAA